MTTLAIIGGSGLNRLSHLAHTERRLVSTPYGQPSGPLLCGTLGGNNLVWFLARHGDGHVIPPHLINYRANIWALHALGVRRVISVAAVGSIRRELAPGSLAVPEQIIDYTYGRQATYFTGAQQGVQHIDFTRPYCEKLRQDTLAAARRAGVGIVDGGVYAATQGPRLETAAEIDRLERDGADLVGMTGMPEAALARELELRYACITVVANHAAGRGTSIGGISLDEIARVLELAMDKVRLILQELAKTDGN